MTLEPATLLAPPGENSRTLDLVTVRAGHAASWNRDEIYGSEGRRLGFLATRDAREQNESLVARTSARLTSRIRGREKPTQGSCPPSDGRAQGTSASQYRPSCHTDLHEMLPVVGTLGTFAN